MILVTWSDGSFGEILRVEKEQTLGISSARYLQVLGPSASHVSYKEGEVTGYGWSVLLSATRFWGNHKV